MLRAWFQRLTPRTILCSALGLFLIYAWPGFVGWDTREHFVQARAGHYTDGHPPAIALLFRICEVFVAGPALLLLMQAVSILFGLYLVLASRLARRTAALAASAIFLFPYISGVTGLIAKDSLMAGALLVAIGLMTSDSPPRHRIALLFLLFASLMRWNAVAATCAPVILLFRWSLASRGLRRYVVAAAAWIGVTAAAYGTNLVLTDEQEHLWHWAYAYEDIAGTLEHVPEMDDETLNRVLEGVPLVHRDRLHERFHALYNPASHYHLMRNEGRIFSIPKNADERAAVAAAWKRIVLGYPAAYLRYRLDNFRLLLAVDRPASFSNVYVWFNVIAAPEVIDELGHDAAPSKIQRRLIDASIWISLTPLYFTFVYFGLCLVLVPLCRERLEHAVILSGLGYQLQWFFLAATADTRYSQWMAICTFVTAILVIARYGRTSIRNMPASAVK